MTRRLYADNAATSNPKPPAVLDAVARYARDLGASAGRGAYREAVESGTLLANCRRKLATLLGAKRPEQIVFTLNCTEALNLAIKGVLREGDHVVSSRMEHNSVLRPLKYLESRGLVDVTYVHADSKTGMIDLDAYFAAVRPNTRLLTLIHASNVTGTLQPLERIVADPRRGPALLLVDAAQTAGHIPINVEQLGIDLLALPGHKGLMGPFGTGALYVRPGLEREIEPLVHGGTGSESERPFQPDVMPDRFESGSHNIFSIAGLNASLDWLLDKGLASIRDDDLRLSQRFLERAAAVDGLEVFGPSDPAHRTAVFSVRVQGLDPGELAAVLETEFGVLTRAGIHCAPFAHETIGTYASGGTTRLSFGAFNTIDDIDCCIDALADVVKSTTSV